MFIALIFMTILFFILLIKRKRKQRNPSFFNELVVCVIGWTSYFALFSINPDLRLLSSIFVGLLLVSGYTVLLALAIFMQKIEEGDRLL